MRKVYCVIPIILLLLFACGLLSSCTSENVTLVVEGETYEVVNAGSADAVLPAAPQKDGYTFDGWYMDEGIWASPINVLPQEEATLYAHYIEGHIHHVDVWTITQRPTCLVAGERQGVCADCGQTVVETMPAKGHTVYVDEAVAPTCYTVGLTEGAHCCECYAVLTKREYVPSLIHRYSDFACVYCGKDYDPVNDAILQSPTLQSILHVNNSSVYSYEGVWQRKGAGTAFALANMGWVYPNNPYIKEGLTAKYYACFIGVSSSDSSTEAAIAEAQRGAGEFLYEIMQRINAGELPDTTAIILQDGVTLDLSAYDWQPVKYFNGFLGALLNEPAIIKGLHVSKGVICDETVALDGVRRNLYLTSFLGVLANARVQGIHFVDMTIESLVPTDIDSPCISIAAPFGAVLMPQDQYYKETDFSYVTVDDTCVVRNAGVASGLVGYVGAYYSADNGRDEPSDLQLPQIGELNMHYCHVSAKVAVTDSGAAYAPCSCLIGSIGTCRGDLDEKGHVKNVLYVQIYYSVVDGQANGYQGVGAAVGDAFGTAVVFMSRMCDFTQAHLIALDTQDLRGVVGTSIYGIDWHSEPRGVSNLPVVVNFDGTALPFIGLEGGVGPRWSNEQPQE